jgi:hypothetical protein
MEKNPNNRKMTMKIVPLFLIAIFLLVACENSESKLGKHKAYLYKTPTPDGLVCVFYGSNEYIIEGNARIFAEMHREKFGIPLTVTTQPY